MLAVSSSASVSRFAGPLNADRPDVLAQLRTRLAELGFNGSATLDALGTPILGDLFHQRRDLPLYLRRLASDTPLNTLVKLFVLDQPVAPSSAEAAFAPVTLTDLSDTGLIHVDASHVRAQVRLSAFQGLLLAHDGYDESRRTLAEDHVIDVNPTTITLATMTPRRQVRHALDVGTGCGVLALIAAAHSDHVVGTDTNPRALNFATFNAALNAVANVSFRQGSLFDPVAGERFDLITCNPADAQAMASPKRSSATAPATWRRVAMPPRCATGSFARAKPGLPRCSVG
jgi:protein-L-isoaspartate O-methyltransferase